MPSKKNEEQIVKKPSIHSIREKKQNRLIIIGFIITAALIVGMVGYALLYDTVFKNYIPVAKVDNRKIDNDFFVNEVRLVRNTYIQQYSNYYAQYQMFAQMEDYASYADYYLSILTQIQSALEDYESLGDSILENMIDSEVLAIEAEEMGITVSDAEVDEIIMQMFSYYPSGTPTPEATTTPYTTPTISAEQKALLGNTATPEATEEIAVEEADEVTEEVAEEVTEEETEEVVEDTETAEVQEEETTEAEAEATATSTEIAATSTVTPTATEYTEDLYQQNYADYLSDLESIGIEEKYMRQYVYDYLLSNKVVEKIYAETPLEQDQVWARHILVETEEEAQDVLARLDDGEDWNTIAAEVSLDTSNNTSGGDLGWFTEGTMVETFEEAAFALEAGEISQPVETDYGWHIIQVIGHEVRPLSEEDYATAQGIYYEDWFEAVKAEREIKINDVWKDLVPDEPALSDDVKVN